MIQEIVKRGQLESKINVSESVLICSTSFEDRWNVVLEDIGSKKWKQVVLFNSPKYSADGLLLSGKFNITSARCVYSEPIDVLLTCNEILVPHLKVLIASGTKIVFDISTFTREMLLIILKVLDHYNFLTHCTFVYTPSKSMNRNWLSKGVLNTRSVLGYAGDFDLGSETHLILFSGFEVERSIEAIEEYEPTYLTVLSGDSRSSYSRDYYSRSKQLVENLKTHYGSNVFSEEIDITDLEKLKNYILELLKSEKFHNQNVVIVPLSNKISTLALGLAMLEFSRAQVIYPQPAEYNVQEYSEAAEEYFIFRM
ncbi:hypothetical protein KJY73_10355 [Bowmanella sp. Y26]|uniref:HFX_2341 family transcriptional regulator domain-containing protein n=1 Tax=Bowmanella yangjiangensis TaxID=2811230 RepID=UPI001BDC7CD3|nr:DUF6293 family protein [Bowmanella yangjiangensis]MBT1063977.1 hypothetical protein [Bowmanella yangjiangensis]